MIFIWFGRGRIKIVTSSKAELLFFFSVNCHCLDTVSWWIKITANIVYLEKKNIKNEQWQIISRLSFGYGYFV